MHLIANAHDLSNAEQELIRAAVGNQGVLEVAVRSETRGRAVVAGRKKFFKAHEQFSDAGDNASDSAQRKWRNIGPY